MSTKHINTAADLVRFGAGVRIDCAKCGANRTLSGTEMVQACGAGDLKASERRLKCSRCGGRKHGWRCCRRFESSGRAPIVLSMRFAPLRRLRYAQRLRERARVTKARWDEVQSVMALIGQITIAWAGVERMLDELIAWCQHRATSLDKPHPYNLRDKLKYLRYMQRDDRLPDGVRHFLQGARDSGKRLGDRRHELIHGLIHRKPVRGGAWQSQRVIYEKALARLTVRNFWNEDFQDLLRDVSDFARYLSPRVWAIACIQSSIAPPPGIDEALLDLGLPARL